jgi:hypothetical protein
VQAVIKPPPAPPVLEFGPASWVKEIRTTTHNNNEVKLRDLVTDNPDDPNDRNWRNGEPDEIEIEWQILQTDFNAGNGGANGELAGAPENLNHGDEVVTRRWEFFKYAGPLDNETGEAMADRVGPDGRHGVGIKTINGVEVNLSNVVVVGEFVGSQMSAFDVDAAVGLIEHVQDGVVDDPYPARTLVIVGSLPFTATNWGVLPAGMDFNRLSGVLSGTPTEAGDFSFTVEANSGTNAPVRRTYTLTIADIGVELPPRSTVDTVASPLDRGTTTGDGTYTNDTTATVTATPAPGSVFKNWVENGKVVSTSASYTFTNIVNRSLVANFAPEGPRMWHVVAAPGALAITWPTNATGYLVQRCTNLNLTNWVNVTNAATIVGTNQQITITPMNGASFFRLMKP